MFRYASLFRYGKLRQISVRRTVPVREAGSVRLWFGTPYQNGTGRTVFGTLGYFGTAKCDRLQYGVPFRYVGLFQYAYGKVPRTVSVRPVPERYGDVPFLVRRTENSTAYDIFFSSVKGLKKTFVSRR